MQKEKRHCTLLSYETGKSYSNFALEKKNKERKKYVIQYEAGRIELIYEPFVPGASVKCIPALYHTAKIKNTYIYEYNKLIF